MKIWMLPFETNYSDFCRNYNGVGGRIGNPRTSHSQHLSDFRRQQLMVDPALPAVASPTHCVRDGGN